MHPIWAQESRALRELLREARTSQYVFISERPTPRPSFRSGISADIRVANNQEDLTRSLHCDGAMMKRQCRAAEFVDHTQPAKPPSLYGPSLKLGWGSTGVHRTRDGDYRVEAASRVPLDSQKLAQH